MRKWFLLIAMIACGLSPGLAQDNCGFTVTPACPNIQNITSSGGTITFSGNGGLAFQVTYKIPAGVTPSSIVVSGCGDQACSVTTVLDTYTGTTNTTRGIKPQDASSNPVPFYKYQVTATYTGTGSINVTTVQTTAALPGGSSSGTGNANYTGTQNVIPKGSATAHTLGDGSMTDDGTHAVASPNGLGTGTGGGLTYDMPNEAVTGTTANTMTCQTAGAYTAKICSHTATTGAIGVAVAGVGTAPGTTGNVSLCYGGKCSVIFDNQTTAGHYAIFSPTAGKDGYLHDTGATTETQGVDNFLIDSANSGAGTNATIKLLSPDQIGASVAGKITGTAPIVVTQGSPGSASVACSTCTVTIAHGTATINPGAVSSNTCSTVIDGGTATGVATTDNIQADFNADPTATTGYVPGAMGTIVKYPTANHVNFYYCNNTGLSITPTSVTLNWRVVR